MYAGVYAIGRPQVTRAGRWMAAVLACGEGAVLSHHSAAALCGLEQAGRDVEITVPSRRRPRVRTIKVHRRDLTDDELTRRDRIPVTSPLLTLIDLASVLRRQALDAAVSSADRLDLIDPESLRRALTLSPRRHGIAKLRCALDRHTLVLTDSELERRFLPIARRASLGRPQTQVWLNGFRVDFYWPELGLVVETDGLRYHRTAEQQARDRRRDQAHTAAGLTPLRFPHSQIASEPAHVERVLRSTARRLRGRNSDP